MITPARADALIASAVRDLGVEPCPIRVTQGRVLRADISADRPQPPYDRVTMDGIAIRVSDWEGGARSFTHAGVQAAGARAQSLPEGPHCVEIMTGSVLPIGADCVIPVERTTRDGDTVSVDDEAIIKQGQFIHATGSDCIEGETVLEASCILNGPRIAIAVSMGAVELSVAKLPRMAIVSTGDELVDVDEAPEPHQIRRSNTYGIAAMFKRSCGIEATMHHLRDDLDEVREGLQRIIEESDIVIMSGGVSMGSFDYVPKALEEIGAEAIYHKIAQRPGKPMWFGKGPAGQAIFALPGNPVSSMVCARRYVWPYVLACMRAAANTPLRVKLSADVTFTPRLHYYLPALLEGDTAHPRPVNTSGDFVSLGATSGFVSLPVDEDNFPAGYACDYYEWL